MSAETPHELMTVRETAELLRVHPNTVYRLAHQGAFPAFKAGPAVSSPIRIARADLDAWLRSRP
jgi:excisionase family DNA binding protein